MQIDENALEAARLAYLRARYPDDPNQGIRPLMHAALLAYEAAKPKEADRLRKAAAACPTIIKAGQQLTKDNVSGTVNVGFFGEVPASEFRCLATLLSSSGIAEGDDGPPTSSAAP